MAFKRSESRSGCTGFSRLKIKTKVIICFSLVNSLILKSPFENLFIVALFALELISILETLILNEDAIFLDSLTLNWAN